MPSSSPEGGTRGMARRAEKGMPHGLFPAGESLELSPGERETLRLLADTIVPRTGDPREPLGGSASDLGVDPLIAQAIQDYQPPDVQKQFLLLLRAVESPLMNLVLAGRPVRFRNLSAGGRGRGPKGGGRGRAHRPRAGWGEPERPRNRVRPAGRRGAGPPSNVSGTPDRAHGRGRGRHRRHGSRRNRLRGRRRGARRAGRGGGGPRPRARGGG